MKKLGDNVRVVGGDTARHVEKYYRKNHNNDTNIVDLSECSKLSEVVINSDKTISVGAGLTIEAFIDVFRKLENQNASKFVKVDFPVYPSAYLLL